MSQGQSQKPIDIYLLRHGRTIKNMQGLTSGGDSNHVLSQEGVSDAENSNTFYNILLGKGIITEKTPIVITESDRTKETAQHFTGRSWDDFIVEKDFNERKFGRWVGILTERLYKELESDEIKPMPDVGESKERHKERVRLALVKWIERAKQEPVIIVSHAGTMRRISSILTGNGDIAVENAVPYHLRSTDGGNTWEIKKLSIVNGDIQEEPVRPKEDKKEQKSKLADILKEHESKISIKPKSDGNSVFILKVDRAKYSKNDIEQLAYDLGELLIGSHYRWNRLVEARHGTISVLLDPKQTEILQVFSQIKGIALPEIVKGRVGTHLG